MDDPLDYYSDDVNNDDSYANYGDYEAPVDEKYDCCDYKVHFKPINCRILNQEDVRQRMEEDISNVSRVFSISKVEASILLCYFNWSVSKVNDVWFVDESEIRKKLGLLEKPGLCRDDDDDAIIECAICFESFSHSGFCSAACGHIYCRECWTNYITTSINNDSLRCLSLRCPEPSCQAAVGRDMVDLLVSREDRKKYSEFMVKSYIEKNRNIKWCPGRGCEYVIEFFPGEGSFDVNCPCFASICWNCNEEGHRPLDCETVKDWILKKGSESENVNYILSHCKLCPNCNRPIEKETGCMNMSCLVCGHCFCWICLGPLAGHKTCKKYIPSITETLKKVMSQQSPEQHNHYFERWEFHKMSKVKAIADFQKMKNEQFKLVSDRLGIPEVHFDFLTNAWQQIVECRRIMAWSCVYGYYLPENQPAKKKFFEYLQEEAESRLENLHNFAGKKLLSLIVAEDPLKELNDYKSYLIQQTIITGNYFEKLVKALESGLPDVDET